MLNTIQFEQIPDGRKIAVFREGHSSRPAPRYNCDGVDLEGITSDAELMAVIRSAMVEMACRQTCRAKLDVEFMVKIVGTFATLFIPKQDFLKWCNSLDKAIIRRPSNIKIADHSRIRR
jgi:hypothetical protein